jgi:hypothetical protein
MFIQFLEQDVDRKMSFIYTWNNSLNKSRQDCLGMEKDVMQETAEILRVQFDGMDQC